MTNAHHTGPTDGPIRLAVLDDHDIVLHGFQALAQSHADRIRVDGVATEVDELIRILDEHPIDIVLLDLHLADGLIDTERIVQLQERVAIVVHTSELRPVPIRAAMRAGARGVALKSDPAELLLEVLTEVAAGGVGMTSDLAHLLAGDEELAVHLTRRELEALQLLSEGVPKQAIGRTMDPPVEQSTVNTYFVRITQRYAAIGREVHNVYGALLEATKDGHLGS